LAADYVNISDYAYVLGDPIKFIDKDGRLVTDENGNVVFTPAAKPMRNLDTRVPGGLIQKGYVTGNDGTQIVAYRNVTSAAGYDTDCHGVTFANENVWIDNAQVEEVLKADGYTEVHDITYVKNDDVVVYRNASSNKVEHSTTVVGTAGGTIQVKGLGGVQTKTRETDVKDGWKKGAKQTYYRKNEAQKENEAGTLPKTIVTKQDNSKTEPLKGVDF